MTIVEVEGRRFYIDGTLKTNLDSLKELIRQDHDMVYIIDGYPRTGKSIFTQQLAKYCDPSFDETQISFDPEEFKKKLINSEKYTGQIFDEAYGGMASRRSMSSTNVKMVDLFAEIGQKNLFIWIVLPDIFDLDKNIAIGRTRGWFHIHTGDNLQRGFFKYYDRKKKELILDLGRKQFLKKHITPDLWGQFTNTYVVDKDKYKAMKEAALRAYRKPEPEPEPKVLVKANLQRDIAIQRLRQKGMKLTELANLFSVTMATVELALRKKIEMPPPKYHMTTVKPILEKDNSISETTPDFAQ